MSNTKTSSSLKTLCRTAIFLALLIAVQFVTRSMGQYVTGSLVNLILIASGLMCGLWGGLAVAVLSPICAFFIGIGPAFPQVVPAVALGNAVLVLLWVLIAGAKNAPIAVRNCKKAINDGISLPIEKAVEVEEKLFGDCFETHDQKEGMACFLSREKPKPKAVFTNN